MTDKRRIKYVYMTTDADGSNPAWWVSDYPGWSEDEVYDGDAEYALMVERYNDHTLVFQTDVEYDAAVAAQNTCRGKV